MNGIEFILRERPVSQSELDRNIIKAAWREAAIEMPQSRNDHSHHRDIDVGARLIERQEIEACLLGRAHAGAHLVAGTETAKLRSRTELNHRLVAWRQEGMVLQAEWSGAVEARFLAGPASD